jgi:hypothetical protein
MAKRKNIRGQRPTTKTEIEGGRKKRLRLVELSLSNTALEVPRGPKWSKKRKSKTLLMSKLWKLYSQERWEDRGTKEKRLRLVEQYFNTIMQILEAKRGQMENPVPKEGHYGGMLMENNCKWRKKEETGVVKPRLLMLEHCKY